MENLEFRKYQMSRLLSVRKLSTAHFLPKVQVYDTPVHRHNSWEFVYCEHGSVEVFNGAERHVLHEDEIVFHPPDLDHHFHVTEKDTTLFILSFVCTSKCMKLFQNKKLPIHSEQRKLMRLIIQELYNAFQLEDGKLLLGDFRPNDNAPMGSEQMVSCYLEGLLISLLRSTASQRGYLWTPVVLEDALENRIAYDIKEYINEHMGERITLGILSEQFHYSRSYITAQFRSCAGMSIMEYLSRVRIERAKHLLTEGGMTIAQIADSLGYSSMQYFSQCFKQAVGCCPSEYVLSRDPFWREKIKSSRQNQAGSAARR